MIDYAIFDWEDLDVQYPDIECHEVDKLVKAITGVVDDHDILGINDRDGSMKIYFRRKPTTRRRLNG